MAFRHRISGALKSHLNRECCLVDLEEDIQPGSWILGEHCTSRSPSDSITGWQCFSQEECFSARIWIINITGPCGHASGTFLQAIGQIPGCEPIDDFTP